MMKKCLLATFVMAVMVLPVSAEMLFNGSFEDVVGSDGVGGDGWGTYDFSSYALGFYQPGDYGANVIESLDGDYHFAAGGSGGGGGGCYQAVPLGAGNTYTASIWGVSQTGWPDPDEHLLRVELNCWGDFNNDGVLDVGEPADKKQQVTILHDADEFITTYTQFSATVGPVPNGTQYGQIDFLHFGTNGNMGMDLASLVLLASQSATEPVPAHEAVEVPVGLSEFKWDNPDVYTATNFKLEVRADDPNWADSGNTYTTASVSDTDSDPLTTTAALPEGLTPDYDTTYFWRVTSTDPNIGGTPQNWVGPNWTFDAESSLLVDSGPSSVTWLDPALATVDLTGSVTVAPGNSIANIEWAVAINPGTELPDKPAGSTVIIASPFSAVTTATMDTQGIYYLELTGEDTGGVVKTELIKVTVASDPCAAAKEDENPPMGYIAPIHDGNGDCKVDLTDFAALASEWLTDLALTENFTYEW